MNNDPAAMQEERQQLFSDLDDIDNHGRYLTDWEADFVDQMLKLMERGDMPTRKQADMIGTIYRKRVLR